MSTHQHYNVNPTDPKINFLKEKQPYSHQLDSNQEQFWLDSIYQKTSPLNIHLNLSKQGDEKFVRQSYNRLEPSVHILENSGANFISEPTKINNPISLSYFNHQRPISDNIRAQNSRGPTNTVRVGSYPSEKLPFDPNKQMMVQSQREQKMNYLSQLPRKRYQPSNNIKITQSQQYYPPQSIRITQNVKQFNHPIPLAKQRNVLQQSRPYFQKTYDNSLKKKEVGYEIDPPSGKPYCTLTVLAILCLLAVIGLIVGLILAFLSQSGPYPNGPLNTDVKQTVKKIQGKIQDIGNNDNNSGTNTVQINGTNSISTNVVKNDAQPIPNQNPATSSQTAFMYRNQASLASTSDNNEVQSPITFVQPLASQTDNSGSQMQGNTAFMYPKHEEQQQNHNLVIQSLNDHKNTLRSNFQGQQN